MSSESMTNSTPIWGKRRSSGAIWPVTETAVLGPKTMMFAGAFVIAARATSRSVASRDSAYALTVRSAF